jgi:RraA family protein
VTETLEQKKPILSQQALAGGVAPPRSAKIHLGPGFRIRSDFARPPRDLLESFTEVQVADLSDQMNRLYAVTADIKPVASSEHRVIGPARTVRVYPGDNLMVHKALDIAKPGDVIVIDAHASTLNAVLGDMICTKAKHRGIAGFIVDGYVRDVEDLVDRDLPVFARGATPVGPLHRGPGEINYPICCGGVVVQPGDIVVADNSGIVILPMAHAASVLHRLMEYLEKSADYRRSLEKGTFSNTWVDDVLAGLGWSGAE